MSNEAQGAERRAAIVTGGSRGIGRGIALELARAGTAVLLTYRSRADEAAEVVKAIQEAGGEAAALACDVASYEAAEAVVAECSQRFGRLDILVNNAGVTQDQLILRMKPEDFDSVIATNLRGTWNLCRAAAKPMLRARGGRIVNLSSVVARMGNPGQTNYAASKGGIEALTRSLARELGSRGITVNAVAPGFIDTEMTAELPAGQKEALLGQIPLGRLGTVEDVAQAVRFLASGAAAYVTGQVIHVNGGLDM
jgi:3-oxoacyl-[acyl-carrier protein] reductase